MDSKRSSAVGRQQKALATFSHAVKSVATVRLSGLIHSCCLSHSAAPETHPVGQPLCLASGISIVCLSESSCAGEGEWARHLLWWNCHSLIIHHALRHRYVQSSPIRYQVSYVLKIVVVVRVSTPSSSQIFRRFGGMVCFQLQGDWISQSGCWNVWLPLVRLVIPQNKSHCWPVTRKPYNNNNNNGNRAYAWRAFIINDKIS